MFPGSLMLGLVISRYKVGEGPSLDEIRIRLERDYGFPGTTKTTTHITV